MKFQLTVITESQTHQQKAERTAKLLHLQLGEGWQIISIEKYIKLSHSYKVQLEKPFLLTSEQQLVMSITQTHQVASPWLLYMHEIDHTIELIFNKNENFRFKKQEFNVIYWAQWQTVI